MIEESIIINISVPAMDPWPEDLRDRLCIARLAKAWAADLDKQIIDDMIARGETSRLRVVKRNPRDMR